MENVHNITINQGSSFAVRFNVKEIDVDGAVTTKNLNGFTARAQLRKGYTASSYQGFTARIYDAAEGIVEISLKATETANLVADVGYVYDVEIVRNSSVTRVAEGRASIRPEVTR